MVECAALEMRCTGNSTVGSNPTLSATIPLRNNIMPLYEAKNPTFLRRFADFDRTSETAENAKIGL